MARPASGPAVMVPRPDSSALPGDDQLAGITIDPERPLLISDADEVLFAFMDGFERHLHDNAKSFSWASFRLNGNIIDDETDEPVEPQAVRSLVYSFFERHTRTLAAVDKAADRPARRLVSTISAGACRSSSSETDPPQVPRWHGSAGSAARSATMSKSTKPGSAAVRAARAGAFTTNFLSPAPLKCECASREPSSMSGRAVATQDVSDSLSCQTAARNRWRCHRSHLRRA